MTSWVVFLVDEDMTFLLFWKGNIFILSKPSGIKSQSKIACSSVIVISQRCMSSCLFGQNDPLEYFFLVSCQLFQHNLLWSILARWSTVRFLNIGSKKSYLHMQTTFDLFFPNIKIGHVIINFNTLATLSLNDRDIWRHMPIFIATEESENQGKGAGKKNT